MTDNTTATSSQDGSAPTAGTGPVQLAIPVVLLALTGWFTLGPETSAVPLPGSTGVDAAAIAPTPLRQPISDPPAMQVAGFSKTCTDCHALFQSAPVPAGPLLQHADIVLDHGLNDRCYNCHSIKDRSKLVLHGEVEIPYSEAVQLCAKCHGPTFRDWEQGMHGKTMGSWQAGPEQRRLICIECHDPHAPAFDPIKPLPGPQTLRMGTPPSEQEVHDEGDPLRRALMAPHDPTDPGAH